MRDSWKLQYRDTSVSVCVHVHACVYVCVMSSYLIANITYYREEESKKLKLVPSFTNRNKKMYNLDAHFEIFILKDARISPNLLV